MRPELATRTRNLRVIPACAGNSCGRLGAGGLLQGHPCVCGEQLTDQEAHMHANGSSLRVRGTAGMAIKDAGTSRVIPACAGNSRHGHQRRRNLTGHPCVCGEQPAWPSKTPEPHGSSLRVRGTADTAVLLIALSRVIPACAGNRPAGGVSHNHRSGHPCVCGEQIGLGAGLVELVGSSLRVRGTDSVSWCTIECSCQIQPP